jgi:hypothetical protein
VIVNWALLKHPMNWVIVTLMVLIAAVAMHFLLQYGSKLEPTAKPSTS